MAYSSPLKNTQTQERHSKCLLACLILGFLVVCCLLVILGLIWFERGKIPLIRNWLSTFTPTSTIPSTSRSTRTPTTRPTSTLTTRPTVTFTPLPTDTPRPTASYTLTKIPTMTSTTTSSQTPTPSLISGESPFLPPPAFPGCTAKRTESFIAGSKFSTFDESYVTGEIVSGEYRMTMKDKNVWAWTTDGLKIGDAVYEVDVEQTVAGSGAYGLVIGADNIDNTQSFYAFVIDSNTNFAIFRHTTNDDWQTVMDWRSSMLLYSGGALNHITIVRSGPMITLFANGFILTSAVYDDTIIGTNYAGLIAWSNDTPGLQAVFDNYSVCPMAQPYPMPVYVGLDDTFMVPAGQPVVLHMGWLAKTHSQAQSFANLAGFTLTLDNHEYTGLSEYWESIMPFAGGYGVDWNLPLALLTPGDHRIEYSLNLSEQITDGFDLDKDGKLDQYGPGVVFNGWVDVNVQK